MEKEYVSTSDSNRYERSCQMVPSSRSPPAGIYLLECTPQPFHVQHRPLGRSQYCEAILQLSELQKLSVGSLNTCF